MDIQAQIIRTRDAIQNLMAQQLVAKADLADALLQQSSLQDRLAQLGPQIQQRQAELGMLMDFATSMTELEDQLSKCEVKTPADGEENKES